MRAQMTPEPARQRIRVPRRSQLTESVPEPAQSERLSSCEDIQESIAKRAYQLYLRRGADHGYDLDDWLQAEREILGPERTA
jgi:hypothetical protein